MHQPFIISCCLLLSCCLYAQDHRLTEDIIRGGDDTVNQVEIFYPTANKNTRQVTDTLFSIQQMQYDPARRGNKVGDLNASYLGSQVFQTYFQPSFSTGFDVGHHAYDLYKFNVDTAAFYDAKFAFSDLFYAQGSNQAKTQTEADFGTNFGDQYISIGYRRVNNAGDYQNQESIHTSLYLGYHLRKEKYDLTLLYGSNVVQDKYSGGITTDTLFGEDLAGALINIPTLLQQAEARHQNRQYLARWNQKIEGLGIFDQVSFETKWSDSYVKIFDTDPNPDFYGNYYIDEVGLRQFIEWNKWRNQLSLSKHFQNKSRYGAGVQYNVVNIYQEPERTSFTELYGKGFLDLFWTQSLSLKSNAQLGLQNERFEWEAEGELMWENNIFTISGLYSISSTLPDLIERRMILRHDLLYDTGLQPILHNSIGGKFAIPDWGLTFSSTYHNFQNYRYFVQDLSAPQTANFNALQITASYHLQLGIFHSDNIIDWQVANPAVLAVPEWQGRHQLYIQTRIFNNNMDITTGLEGRYYLNYTPIYYQPFYGEFFLADGSAFESVPYLLDYFLGFRVQTFHFLLRIEHIPQAFQTARFYSQYRQPYSNFGFRLGVRWRLSK